LGERNREEGMEWEWKGKERKDRKKEKGRGMEFRGWSLHYWL